MGAEEKQEPVILAGVWETSGKEYPSEDAFAHSMKELHALAEACGMCPVGQMVQRLPKVNAALYAGAGKIEEISNLVQETGVERVIFNDTLTPSQLRNLQKLLNASIMDRTGLILEIFDRRARSREARLQVEMARLNYLKPRLIGMWETQNRQGGASGSLSARGEGEKQLEIDRRLIDQRLAELKRELKRVDRERSTQRKKRQKAGIPLVALVGYTNAGKSTILNAMLQEWGIGTEKEKREVLEADMLFATLDTTIRRIQVSRGRQFLLSDTVGFIHKLPTLLVEAFKSTLEEVTQADLILQVVDHSDPFYRDHIEVTRKTIAEIGAGHIPVITVYNKTDQVIPPVPYPLVKGKRKPEEGDQFPDRETEVFLSAREENSIRLLTETILETLERKNVTREFRIPYSRGNVQSFLMEHAQVQETEYREDGILLRVRCSKAVADKVERDLE